MTRAHLSFCLLLVGVLPATAQIDYAVLKETGYDQSSNATPSLVSQTNGDPYGSGTNPGPYFLYAFDRVSPQGTASTLTTPNGSFALTYNSNNGSPTYFSAGYATVAALNLALPDGTYGISSTSGSSGNLSVLSSSFPTLPQLLSVNGVAPIWSGGQLLLDPSIANSLTWTVDSTWSNSVGSHSEFEIFDTSVNDGDTTGANAASTPSDTRSYTITAGTLTLGTQYAAILNYTQLTQMSTASTGLAVTGDQVDNSFAIEAVPEPSTTWLLVLGTVGMVTWQFSSRHRAVGVRNKD